MYCEMYDTLIYRLSVTCPLKAAFCLFTALYAIDWSLHHKSFLQNRRLRLLNAHSFHSQLKHRDQRPSSSVYPRARYNSQTVG